MIKRISYTDEHGKLTSVEVVVEVISPSTGKKDRTIKLYKYQKAGVREYWIVDPKKTSRSVHSRVF